MSNRDPSTLPLEYEYFPKDDDYLSTSQHYSTTTVSRNRRTTEGLQKQGEGTSCLGRSKVIGEVTFGTLGCNPFATVELVGK
jgi:hypothetical protein